MKRVVFRTLLPVLAVCIMIAWCLWPRDRVVPSVVKQLKEGMALEEVLDLLGPAMNMSKYWCYYDYHETIEDKEGRYWIGHYHFAPKSSRRASIKTVGRNLPLIDWSDQDNCAFVWMGSQVCIIARFEHNGLQMKLIGCHIAPIVRSEETAFEWIDREYRKWRQAASTAPAPAYPVTSSPPPPPTAPPPPRPPPLPKKLKN